MAQNSKILFNSKKLYKILLYVFNKCVLLFGYAVFEESFINLYLLIIYLYQ